MAAIRRLAAFLLAEHSPGRGAQVGALARLNGAKGAGPATDGLTSEVRRQSSDFEPKIGACQGNQPANGRDPPPCRFFVGRALARERGSGWGPRSPKRRERRGPGDRWSDVRSQTSVVRLRAQDRGLSRKPTRQWPRSAALPLFCWPSTRPGEGLRLGPSLA